MSHSVHEPKRAALTVFSTLSAKEALIELVPAFERMSGCTVDISYTPAPKLAERIRSGTRGDLFIGPEEYSDPLIAEGWLQAGTRMPFARSGAGLAVQAGAAKPDISTPEKLKTALLAARSVTYSEGASGMLFAKAIAQLDIAEAIAAKFVAPRPDEMIGEVVARGGAEIGVQQLSALMPVDGIDIVGWLPEPLQQPILYGTTRFANAGAFDTADAYTRFLRSDVAAAVLLKKGLTPA